MKIHHVIMTTISSNRKFVNTDSIGVFGDFQEAKGCLTATAAEEADEQGAELQKCILPKREIIKYKNSKRLMIIEIVTAKLNMRIEQ